MPSKFPKKREYKPRHRCSICHQVMTAATSVNRWHMILSDGSDSYSHDQCVKAQRNLI